MANIPAAAPKKMDLLARFFYRYRKISKFLKLFFLIAGPGIIVMVADNDAGGITTYAATGAKFGYGFILFLIILGPIAYVVQEMTIRLGAITKRGHAEAIFDATG
jgi:Mn2+/Fe2+ NRAMP family transporter